MQGKYPTNCATALAPRTLSLIRASGNCLVSISLASSCSRHEGAALGEAEHCQESMAHALLTPLCGLRDLLGAGLLETLVLVCS